MRVCVGSLDQVQLLYATTAHRAEGTTVDTAHPLITAGMTREALYVLATRARESTVFYVATHYLPFDEDDRVRSNRRHSAPINRTQDRNQPSTRD